MTEIKGNAEIARKKVEMLKLTAVLKEAGLADQYDLLAVGEAGYAVIKKQPSELGLGLVAVDFDDTAYDTTEGHKSLRKDLNEYLVGQGINLTDGEVEKMWLMAESFSNWPETAEAGKIDHPLVKMTVLTWVTRQLQQTRGESEKVLDLAATRLLRIKSQLSGTGEVATDDPFMFAASKRLFKLRGLTNRFDSQMGEIFQSAFVKNHLVKEVVQAMGRLSDDRLAQVGMFTKGDPVTQLMKAVGSLAVAGHMPVEQIWLTTVEKGKFLTELVGMAEKHGAPDGLVRLFKQPATITLIDNNPEDLDRFLAAGQELGNKTATAFSAIRFHLPGGWKHEVPWVVDAPNAEVFFENGKPADLRQKIIGSMEKAIKLRYDKA